MKRAAVLAATFAGVATALVGCQSESEAYRRICDAPDHLSLPANASSSAREAALWRWIHEEVSNRAALDTLEALRGLTFAERAERLRNLAEAHDIAYCTLAEFYAENAPPEPEAAPVPAERPAPAPGPEATDSAATPPPPDAKTVDAVIQEHLEEVQACRAASEHEGAPPKGTVVVQFLVGVDGRVAGASIGENTTGDEALADCLIDFIEDLDFPPAPSGVAVVRYPFRFRGPEAPAAAAAGGRGPEEGNAPEGAPEAGRGEANEATPAGNAPSAAAAEEE
ncbi:MAG: energy transducer TonB [Deltaproteobacteria bacterium]|nr:MAG: energy transducer TonB [Deltaproteobacteria bacterium]